MEIKVGDLLKVKTTGENVLVLGFNEDETATVRRASLNRDSGVQHIQSQFFPYELETPLAFMDRQISEETYVQNALQGAKNAAFKDIFDAGKKGQPN